jgi:CMP-N-acetylneuraminic acid synthetase
MAIERERRPRVLGVIPARGGSVGLPRKNLRLFRGLPLIAHAILTARECQTVTRTIVTTDDPEIASVARSFGADVPFLRPAALARAESRMFDVLLHAVEWLDRSADQPYDDVLLLQPTSPMRTVEDADDCVRALWRAGADSAITVYRHEQVHPRLMYTLLPDGTATPIWTSRDRMPQRQDLQPVHIRCGVAYAFRRSLLVPGGDIYGRRTVAVQVPYERSVSIDDPADLAVGEAFAALADQRETPPVPVLAIRGL